MDTIKFLILACVIIQIAFANSDPQSDTIPTSSGNLLLTFIGHGSLMLSFQNKTIQVDPFGKLIDYSKFKPADIILITHEHYDHFDKGSIKKITCDSSVIIGPAMISGELRDVTVLRNCESIKIKDITIEAVPAYNIVHKRKNGHPYHDKGEGNGYVLTLGDKRVYIAGDTENIPEMANLEKIDIAFLPMNQPYTMTPPMAADAAKKINPKILYPYHFSDTDPAEIKELLKSERNIEVRIRNMK